jgi:4-hydroxyproline epimerase
LRAAPTAFLMSENILRVHVVDSHTGGEPTRVVVSGGPDLGAGPLDARVHQFRKAHDAFRAAIVNEPRGSDVMIGALLCEPHDKTCTAGVIFFNNVGYLGMCGHGTIGLLVTLAHLGKIRAGSHRIETPVGIVDAKLGESGEVTVRNVPSYRLRKNVPVNVPPYGKFSGDIAWGGNWFYLIYENSFDISFGNAEKLTEFTWAVRQALRAEGITGTGGAEIDHIELFGPPQVPGADSKNFVLCPGKIYDRSPCGTGTCAKLACLYEDGKLKLGEAYRQESIVGSVFEGSVEVEGDAANPIIVPSVRGTAFVTGEADLILDPNDPFCWGIGG